MISKIKNKAYKKFFNCGSFGHRISKVEKQKHCKAAKHLCSICKRYGHFENVCCKNRSAENIIEENSDIGEEVSSLGAISSLQEFEIHSNVLLEEKTDTQQMSRLRGGGRKNKGGDHLKSLPLSLWQNSTPF